VGAVADLNDILARLEPSLGPVDGTPSPLEGGITNRNFKVVFGGEPYVLRLHGKETELLGISREAERQANEAAAQLGIAPPVAGVFEGGLVTRYLECAPLEPRELAARVEEVGRALRAFHDSATELEARFWVPDLLSDYARIALERGAVLPEGYGQAQRIAGEIGAALGEQALRPCHNDLLPGNLLREREEDRIMIVDWEYAGMGHPWFDLGNLSVNNDFDPDTDERLLRAYLQAEPTARDRARLALARLLSDAREAAWGVMQGCVSDLDFDFAGYAAKHFERLAGAAGGPDYEQRLTTVGG
jgi:thiamine kinase-like enzyme